PSDDSDVAKERAELRTTRDPVAFPAQNRTPPLANKSPPERTRMFPSSSYRVAKSETSDFAAILSETGERECKGDWVRGDRFGGWNAEIAVI
ncbi:MAG: hypothetical protein AAF346_16400, partial [Pseudomonadota bacterium]